MRLRAAQERFPFCVSFFLGPFFLPYKGKKVWWWEDEEEKNSVGRRWIGGTCGGSEAAYVEAMFPKREEKSERVCVNGNNLNSGRQAS